MVAITKIMKMEKNYTHSILLSTRKNKNELSPFRLRTLFFQSLTFIDILTIFTFFLTQIVWLIDQKIGAERHEYNIEHSICPVILAYHGNRAGKNLINRTILLLYIIIHEFGRSYKCTHFRITTFSLPTNEMKSFLGCVFFG